MDYTGTMGYIILAKGVFEQKKELNDMVFFESKTTCIVQVFFFLIREKGMKRVYVDIYIKYAEIWLLVKVRFYMIMQAM